MATKKIQIISPGGDMLYPETSGDQVKAADGTTFEAHKAETATNAHLPLNVGLGNVNNVKQLPIAGGTMTGVLTAQNNTSYTTKQVRNITLSTADASGGGNGDIWLKYA
jgi:hypothetical protein